MIHKPIGPIKGQQSAIEEESRNGVGREDRVRYSINTKLHFIVRILVVKNRLNEQIRKVDALDLQIFAFASPSPPGWDGAFRRVPDIAKGRSRGGNTICDRQRL